jgi:lysozyme
MKRKMVFGVFGFIAVFFITTVILLYNGIIWFNNPSPKKYPVRGVDVSHHQGVIDWEVLSQQNINFAFIKATEGSSFKDKMFEYNWENARKTHLMVGAYHFYSFESSGITQAQNFISVVPVEEDMLPPVIDFELFGDVENNPLLKEQALEILNDIITEFEEHYGLRPIIYTTQRAYELYLKGGYEDCPLWVRDVFKKPDWLTDGDWTFWQYSNRKVLKGYNSRERFIDMNVFNGTQADFEKFIEESRLDRP